MYRRLDPHALKGEELLLAAVAAAEGKKYCSTESAMPAGPRLMRRATRRSAEGFRRSSRWSLASCSTTQRRVVITQRAPKNAAKKTAVSAPNSTKSAACTAKRRTMTTRQYTVAARR